MCYIVVFFSQNLLGRIYPSASANKHYSSKWSILANLDKCWTNAVITHDYSPLFATIRDYSRLFSTIRTIRTNRYSLFGFSRHHFSSTFSLLVGGECGPDSRSKNPSCCYRGEWAWSERARQLSNQKKITLSGLQSLFLTKRKELWLCANGRFRMRNGMPQGIVVIREWEYLGCAAYQSHV